MKTAVVVLLFQRNLKQMMECVRKGDVENLTKLLNKGLDPNFVDSTSGGMIKTFGLLSRLFD